MNKSRMIFVVYDPPKPDFPYLSVVFHTDKMDEPMVTPFRTAAEAEAFNTQAAAKVATEVK